MNLDNTILELQEKNVQAFEKLYNMYSDSIFGVIYTIVKDYELAQEILQDVFLKVWNNAKSYQRNKGRFFTWLLNIARNAAIDKTRSKSFKNSKKNLSIDFYVNIIDAQESVLDKTDTIGIKKFVSQLTENCKKIINLIYFKGFTQKDTSESLNIPLGTVKTRNRTCLKELKEILKV
jgi:RNA polymerase sigma-70 factor (ECF subfamily)